MKHILLYFLIASSGISSLISQTSSLLWKVTSPNGQLTSYLLGASNEPDTRGMVMPKGIEELIASCEIFYTAEDLFIQNIVNKTYKSFPEYWAEQTRIKYQPDFNQLMRAFQSRYGLDSERFYHDRTLLTNVARTGRSYAYGYTPPVEQIAAFALTLGLVVEGIDPELLSNPTLDIPEEIWSEYFSWIIDEQNSNQKNSEYYNALRRGNLAYFSAWKSSATDIDYFIRTKRLAHEFRQQTTRLCNQIPVILGRESAFVVLQPEHLPGEDGVLNILKEAGFALERLPRNFVPLELTSAPARLEPDWQPLQITDLPFSLQVPGKMTTSAQNTAIIPETALTYHHLELTPNGGPTFCILRLPKPPLLKEEHIYNLQMLGKDIAVRIGGTKFPYELLPVSDASGYDRPVLEFSGFNFNIAAAEKSLQESGMSTIGLGQYQRSGPKEIIRAFYTKFEYVILYANHLTNQTQIDLARQIMESLEFIPMEEEKMLHRAHDLGYEILLPYTGFPVKTTVPITGTLEEMEIKLVNCLRSANKPGFTVASGMLAENSTFVNDKEELTRYMKEFENQPLFQQATQKGFRTQYSDSCAVAEISFTISDGFDIKKGTEVTATYMIRGSRNYIITSFDENLGDGPLLRECKESFSFVPFLEPTLNSYIDPENRYELLLPQKLNYCPREQEPTELDDLLVRRADIYTSQDTFSGNSIGIMSVEYNRFFQYDREKLDSLGDILFQQLWPVENSQYEVLSTSTFTRNGLLFCEYLIHPENTHNHVRILNLINGEWSHALYLFGPKSFLFQPWVDQVFSSFRPLNAKEPEFFKDKSDLIIQTINTGTDQEILESLAVLQTCYLPEESADNYFRFLRDDPPFTHPNQLIIFPELLRTIAYWKPDSVEKLAKSLFDRTFDPELQGIILETLSQLSFPGYSEVFAYGLKQTNWQMFDNQLPPLYGFLEVSLDTITGPLVWEVVPELLDMEFWRIPIATYLPAAKKLGIVTDEVTSIINDHMRDLAVTLWKKIESNSTQSSQKADDELALATCLNALSIEKPDKSLLKLFKKIRKAKTGSFLQSQILYNQIAWDLAVEEEVLVEYVENLDYRKKLLSILNATDNLSEVPDRLYSSYSRAEADTYVAVSDGFVEADLALFKLLTSWKDEHGYRYVFEVKILPEDPVTYVLSPAYVEGVFEPVYPPDSYFFIQPEGEVDLKNLASIFKELAE